MINKKDIAPMIKSFVSHFEHSVLLKEGGNVKVETSPGQYIQADKVDLNKFSRAKLVSLLLDFFHNLNNLFEKFSSEKLWPLSEDINSGHIFNGSSEHFFNSQISDKEFKLHKPRVGDIDVTVPIDKKEILFKFLKSLEGSKVTPSITFIGSKQNVVGEGHQINSLVNINNELNLQIDFEFSSYENNKPSSFAKFSHSSDWEDIKQGFKGVLHKYLLQSVASVSDIKKEEEAVLLTPASTEENIKISKAFPEKGLTFKKFSVGRGLRTNAYFPVLDKEGKPIKINNRTAYKERPPSESEYIQDPLEIGKIVFGTKFSSSELLKLNSFVGVIELCNKYFSEQVKMDILNDFVKRLFNLGSQGFERDNPSADYDVKKTGFNSLKQKFNIKSVSNLPDSLQELMNQNITNDFFEKVKSYYQNYGTRKRK